jgi:hypothetical protein
MATVLAPPQRQSTLPIAPATQRPLFIQGIFRTGGTYLWSKFRKLPGYRAYYEPLNEVLAKAEEDARTTVNDFVGMARHPRADFYFAEFPFRIGGGVEYFQESFSLESYALAENASDEPLRRYFTHLLTYSLAHQQVPVFKFDRASLRAGWLTANFSPLNLLVLRNPRDVWESFRSFGDDDPFKTILCMTLGRNRHHPLLGDLANRLGLPECPFVATAEVFDCYRGWAAQMGDALYPFFFEFYVLTTLHCARYADCILDMTGISSDPVLKAAVTSRLKELRIPISLEDCRMPSPQLSEVTRSEVAKVENDCLAGLNGRLPEEFLIPEQQWARLGPSVSDYFSNIFSRFQTSAAVRFARADSKLRTEAKKQEALRLISTHHALEGGQLLSEILQREQTPELWEQWAEAQVANSHPVSAAAGFRRAAEFSSRRRAPLRHLRVVLRERNLALVRMLTNKGIVVRRFLERLSRRSGKVLSTRKIAITRSA